MNKQCLKDMIHDYVTNIFFIEKYEYNYDDESKYIINVRLKFCDYINIKKQTKFLDTLTKTANKCGFKYTEHVYNLHNYHTFKVYYNEHLDKPEQKTPPECYEPICEYCEYKSNCKNNEENNIVISKWKKNVIEEYVEDLIFKFNKTYPNCKFKCKEEKQLKIRSYVYYRFSMDLNDYERDYANEYFNKIIDDLK